GGGAGINTTASELIQEGLVIPPLRLNMPRDLYGGAVERLIFANIRTAELGRGDFYAQVAANRTGVQRMCELGERVGKETLRLAMSETLKYAERRMRAAISELPDGTWDGEAWIDNDVGGTERLPIKVRVTIRKS